MFDDIIAKWDTENLKAQIAMKRIVHSEPTRAHDCQSKD